jgi:DNA-binding NarL/FixJ family response regulator
MFEHTHIETPIKVFLVDDHPVVCSGLKALLESEPDMVVVGEAGDGIMAQQGVATLRPHVVIMDLLLPRLNGVQATQQIKASFPDVQVLALTALDQPDQLRQALSAGASSVMLKHTAAEELVSAIRCIARGGRYLDQNIAAQIARLDAEQQGSAPRPALSEREKAVLKMLAAGHSAKEMAAKLCISARTLETYRARAMDKLALKSRADIVRYAAQQGWLGGS